MPEDNLHSRSTNKLLHFPAPTPLPISPHPVLLADVSTLEVAILATLWNYHPRPMRISEIYLAVRTSAGGRLEPCAAAVNELALRGLISHSGTPSFCYQLNHDGVFTALYLAIAGAGNKFKIARVPEDVDASEHAHPLTRVLPDPLARPPIVKPASEVEIEFCHTGCGRIATGHCECGNPMCTAHRYNTDGQHDSAGACSACYDDVMAERIGIQQHGEV